MRNRILIILAALFFAVPSFGQKWSYGKQPTAGQPSRYAPSSQIRKGTKKNQFLVTIGQDSSLRYVDSDSAATLLGMSGGQRDIYYLTTRYLSTDSLLLKYVFWDEISQSYVLSGVANTYVDNVINKAVNYEKVNDSTWVYYNTDFGNDTITLTSASPGLLKDRIEFGDSQDMRTTDSKFLYKNKGILLNTNEDSTAALNILATDGTVGQRAAIDFIPYSRAYYNSVFPSHPTIRHLEFNPEKLVGIGHGNPYGKFEFRSSFGKDDNLPDTSGNMIHNFGFNIDRTATKMPAMYLSWEQRYTYGLGRQFAEFHLECKDTLGRNYRPLTFSTPYDGIGGDIGFTVDRMKIFKGNQIGTDYWTTGVEPWVDNNYLTGLDDHFGNYHLNIRGSTLNNIVSKYSKKYNGSVPYVRNILTMDDNDIVMVGDSGGIQVKNTILLQRENAARPIIKSLDRYLRFDSTRVDVYSTDPNGRYINLVNQAESKRVSFCFEPDNFFLESNTGTRPMIIDSRAPTYSLAVGQGGHVAINLGGNTNPYHSLEVGGDAAVNGYVRLQTTFANDGTGVLNGSIFKGVSGGLYYKSDGGTVTLIAPN